MSLEELRGEIDALDEELIPLLEKRFAVVAKMAPFKKGLTDGAREDEILAKGATEEVRALYKELFRISKGLLRDSGLSE